MVREQSRVLSMCYMEKRSDLFQFNTCTRTFIYRWHFILQRRANMTELCKLEEVSEVIFNKNNHPDPVYNINPRTFAIDCDVIAIRSVNTDTTLSVKKYNGKVAWSC